MVLAVLLAAGEKRSNRDLKPSGRPGQPFDVGRGRLRNPLSSAESCGKLDRSIPSPGTAVSIDMNQCDERP